jgi:hypothetical protein
MNKYFFNFIYTYEEVITWFDELVRTERNDENNVFYGGYA